jgi:hypothetical protein
VLDAAKKDLGELKKTAIGKGDAVTAGPGLGPSDDKDKKDRLSLKTAEASPAFRVTCSRIDVLPYTARLSFFLLGDGGLWNS